MRVKELKRCIVTGVLAVSCAFCHAKENTKDWTMTNVVPHADSQVKLKNCTNVQLPLLDERKQTGKTNPVTNELVALPSLQAKPYVIGAAPSHITLSPKALFESDAEWATVARQIDLYKYYGVQLIKDVKWATQLDPKALVDFTKARNIKLGCEFGDFNFIKDAKDASEHAFRQLDPIFEVGGEVSSIHLDGPVRHMLKGHQESPNALSLNEVAVRMVRFFKQIRKKYPNIRIGVITNFPNWDYTADLVGYNGHYTDRSGVTYSEVLDVLHRVLADADEKINFVEVDCPYNYYREKRSRSDDADIDNARKLTKLQQWCKERAIGFNLIVNAEPRTEGAKGFHDMTCEYVQQLRRDGIFPDVFIVQSWYKQPAKHLPETERYTFMNTAKDAIALIKKRYPDKAAADNETAVRKEPGSADTVDQLLEHTELTRHAANGTYGCRWSFGYGVYNASVNKTVICWNGEKMSIYVREFDHTTQRWSKPVKAYGLNYVNYHNYPCIALAPDGHYLIFYFKHSSAAYMVKSQSPNRITGTWAHRKLSGDKCAYPMPIVVGDTVYLFYSSTVALWHRPYRMTSSTDNGKTWSEPITLIDSDHKQKDKYDEVYAHGFSVEKGKNDKPDRILLGWEMRSGPKGHNKGGYGNFFAYFNCRDQKMYNAGGKDLGDTVDLQEMYRNCIINDAKSPDSRPFGQTTLPEVLPDGSPGVLYTLNDKTYIAQWKEGAWKTTKLEVTGRISDYQRTNQGTYVILSSGNKNITNAAFDLINRAPFSNYAMLSGGNKNITVWESKNGVTGWQKRTVAELPGEMGSDTAAYGFIDGFKPEVQWMAATYDRKNRKNDYSGKWPVYTFGAKRR